MDSIGGYFELEEYGTGSVFPHNYGVMLNTGRNALEFILRSIGIVKGVYLPYYTCEVVLEPLKKLNIPWVYYRTNNRFEIEDDIYPKNDEYIIANNYYGIKDAYIMGLAKKYGKHLIVDCAQSLFAKPIPEIKCFYSIRKFVGVADGGIAYLGNIKPFPVSINEYECTVNHDSHLFKRKKFGPEAGFADFQENEKKLDNQPIRWMSDTTKSILEHIDYNFIIDRRRDNYIFLHKALSENNFLNLPDTDTFACPMGYPFMTRIDRDLRKELINNKIFVAKYWPNVQHLRDFETEYQMANRVVLLPCDQRYGEKEMNRIVGIINK